MYFLLINGSFMNRCCQLFVCRNSRSDRKHSRHVCLCAASPCRDLFTFSVDPLFISTRRTLSNCTALQRWVPFSHVMVRRNSPALFSETPKRHQWCQSRRCCAPPAPSSRSWSQQGWSRAPPRSLWHSWPSTAGSAASPATPDRTACASAASASPSELWRCPGPPRLPPWSQLQTLWNPSVRQAGRSQTERNRSKSSFRRRSGGSDRPSCRGREGKRIY